MGARLSVYLCGHRRRPGVIVVRVDHVRRDVAALAFELFYLLAVSAQHLVRRSVRRQFDRRLPAFVVDANPREVVADFAVFAERTVLIGDSEDSHGNQLPSSASAGITRSVQRQSGPALPSGTPEFQHGAWLPASPHPKYKAHALSEENRGCRGSLAEFSTRARPVLSCPVNSQEWEATRGASESDRLPPPSPFRTLRPRSHPLHRATPKGQCSKPTGCAQQLRHAHRARWRDGGGLPRKADHRRAPR